MDPFEQLADQAEEEIGLALEHCRSALHSGESRARLWNTFRTWLRHPSISEFALSCRVLNHLEWTLAESPLVEEGWALIAEMAALWHREGNEAAKESLRIASLEIAAEPPEVPLTLNLLFSLAGNPDTRWAVFAAYEHFPWRLRPHAHKYSKGSVTDEDCDHWLAERGLGEDEILRAGCPKA